MKMEGQLQLFMTAEQEEQVNRCIQNSKRNLEIAQANTQRSLETLLEGGLQLGVHFKNTLQIHKDVTKTVELGGWRDENKFEAEVTVDEYTGGVFLLYDIIVKEDGVRKIVKKDTWFSVTSDGKVECSTIVGSFRAVKASTILNKIIDMNAATKDRLKMVEQKDIHFDNALAKLRDEFPNAEQVNRGTEWVNTRTFKNSYHQDVITVAFEDGSYINYDVNTFNGEISVRKVYDVVVETLTLQDKVNNLKTRLQ
jgi:hypothetical protein